MNKRRVWALVLTIVMALSVFAYAPVQSVEAAGVSVQYKSHIQTFVGNLPGSVMEKPPEQVEKQNGWKESGLQFPETTWGSVIQHIARHMAGSHGFRMER